MCEAIQYEHSKKKKKKKVVYSRFHIDFLVGLIHVKARHSC